VFHRIDFYHKNFIDECFQSVHAREIIIENGFHPKKGTKNNFRIDGVKGSF